MGDLFNSISGLPLPITFMYGSLLGLLYVTLSMGVSMSRMKKGILLGDGGDDGMQKNIRAHANLAEYVPFALILLAFTEGSPAESGLVHFLGGMLFLARLLHAYGMIIARGVNLFRFVGTLATYGVIATTSLIGIYYTLVA